MAGFPAMSPNNLERYVPGLREARAEEQQNRALAFAGLTCTVCDMEIEQLTPNHRLALQLVRNAIIFGVRAEAGDVLQFLWTLSPGFKDPRNMDSASKALHAAIKEHVKGMDIKKAGEELAEYYAAQLQDSPELQENDGPDISSHVYWMAVEASFWLDLHGGFTLESYRRTPYLVLQQLARVWRCNHPKMIKRPDGGFDVDHPQFINRSDKIAGDWQRAQSEEIKTQILSQRERLPG